MLQRQFASGGCGKRYRSLQVAVFPTAVTTVGDKSTRFCGPHHCLLVYDHFRSHGSDGVGDLRMFRYHQIRVEAVCHLREKRRYRRTDGNQIAIACELDLQRVAILFRQARMK